MTLEMARYTARCVERAGRKGWSIVCGDAEGVDNEVYWTCTRKDILVEVFGCYPWPRTDILPKDFIRVSAPGVWTAKQMFMFRDRVMANYADRTLAIVNAESKTQGAKYTWSWAHRQGKIADIRYF